VDIGEFLARLDGVRRSGTGWVARCPAHDDHNEAIARAMGLTMKDLSRERPSSTKKNAKKTARGLTLEQYSEAKKLPVDFLEDLGLYSTGSKLCIPYRDENKFDVAVRYRHAISGGRKFSWRKGSTPVLYGLWRLKKDRDTVILVEGESDAHTLWRHNYNALGLPGAATWKEERDAQHLQPFEKIFVVHEKDQGGRHLIRKLAESALAPRIFVVSLASHKDPSDLHVSDPEKFKARFDEALKKAVPIAEVAEKLKAAAKEKTDRVAKVVEELNRKHAIVMVGGRCCVLTNEVDPTFERAGFVLSSVQDMRNFYRNKHVVVEEETSNGVKYKSVPAFDLWLESPKRKTYRGIVFDPAQKTNSDYFNLYAGLAVKPRLGGGYTAFENHIYNVVAAGNDAVFRYVWRWIAYKIQNLGKERCQVALVLRGPRGAGKGVFVNTIGKIFGRHFLHVTSQNQILGRFNGAMQGALLVFIDEGFWAGDKAGEGLLKGYITEDTLSIEMKGREIFQIKNHADFIFASNNSWVVPSGFKERRFCVLDVSPAHIGNHDYFKKIIDEISNGGLETLLHGLLHVDLSGFDPRDFPKTEALTDQIIRTMGSVKKYWLDELQGGSPDVFGSWVATDDLAARYRNFCESIRERYPQQRKILFRELKELWPPGVRAMRPTIGSERRRGYQMPELEECRAAFEEKMGCKIAWEDAE